MRADVCVIGAGPAGSSAAWALARQGLDVAIIEARAFPRAKVCGEFISPSGVEPLEAILPREELARLGARRIERVEIERAGEVGRGPDVLAWRMPAPGWALSRASLDLALLDRARASGARVLQPARAARVAHEPGQAIVSIAGGGRVRARVVVHADGTGRLDASGSVPARRDVVALKCHVRAGSASPASVRLRAAKGAYVGTITIEGGLGTCALVVSKAVLRAEPHPDRVLDRLAPGVGSRASEWLSCGVPAAGYVGPGALRSFRVGNAAAAVDPAGGEGIALALWSGTRLGALLALGLDDESLARAHAALAREYRARTRLRRWTCRAGSGLLMRPRLLGMGWPVLRLVGLEPWYRLSGKPMRLRSMP